MKYVLRDSEPKDKAWLESLRRDVYRELFDLTWGGWDEERHQWHFSSFWEGVHIHIIEVSGIPVGVLQIFESQNDIEVGEIQVLQSYQGQGLGTQVLKDVIKRGKNIILATGLKNTKACKFYKELGFVENRRTDTHMMLEQRA